LDLIHSMVGFENAHITRPGYAIEYDYFDPQDLKHSLETKFVNNLFFAGQINGTTGYEEAGAQGLLAGTNAGLQALEKDAWVPRRDQSYIGVLVDDLITMGTKEPYRMFTSRAEYRLVLREDNADLRLTEIGRDLGLVDDARWAAFTTKRESIEQEAQRLRTTWVQPKTPEAEALITMGEVAISHEYNLHELLKRPGLNYVQVASLKGEPVADPQVAEQIEIQAKYDGYIARQLDEIEQLRRYENTLLPADLDYEAIGGLSNEVKQKLDNLKPATLGVASRISGITPAAISQILIHLKKRNLAGKMSA
jgi:tRNA uridine 5-carboxymethylaminomethyl modification enzyme